MEYISIKVNEKNIKIRDGLMINDLKKEFKKDADLVILNGFILNHDQKIKPNDVINFIKKGEVPSKEELESLMISRHTPGIHNKIKNSRVAILGLGGLGSNVAISLARMGLGYIKLIDYDIVEPSNLNRQQYEINDIGKYKTIALKDKIEKINPFINIEIINKYIKEENILDLVNDVDYVIEAFDNPETKSNIVNQILTKDDKKIVIAGSGMAGYSDSNKIKTKKVNDRFFICGDLISGAKENWGLMAPRVAIVANHQANLLINLIVKENE